MDILEKIMLNKRLEIEQWKIEQPMEALVEQLEIGPRYSFKDAISGEGVNIIAEIKKASPSKGIISEKFDPIDIAAGYRAGGASAISVLTEQKYFKGHPKYLDLAKRTAQLPVLCKDFIVDKYQVYFARAMNADAILLIASLLNAQQMDEFITLARELGMDCLVEVHTEDELNKVLATQAEIIGVNSRQLSTFDVSLDRTRALGARIPNDRIRVAESGISTVDQIRQLRQTGYHAYLVGETLMRAENPARKLEELRAV